MSQDLLQIRDLQKEDFHKGYLQLLEQLTTVGDVSEQQFLERLSEIQALSPDYKILVVEDTSTSRIVGSATAMMERKFIHQCGKVAHIEDVVVDGSCRGQKLGQSQLDALLPRLIQALVDVSRERGCYKVILDCSESNLAFYEKCGLTRKEVQMVKYLDR